MPALASAKCELYRLPANPTKSDLEIGYATRGAQVVSCDAKRQLAVDTHEAEHKLEAQFKAMTAERNKPWWHFWKTKVARDLNR